MLCSVGLVSFHINKVCFESVCCIDEIALLFVGIKNNIRDLEL